MISRFESGRNILKFLERSFKLSLNASIMQWSYSNCITNIKVNVSYYISLFLSWGRFVAKADFICKGCKFLSWKVNEETSSAIVKQFRFLLKAKVHYVKKLFLCAELACS